MFISRFFFFFFLGDGIVKIAIHVHYSPWLASSPFLIRAAVQVQYNSISKGGIAARVSTQGRCTQPLGLTDPEVFVQ